MSFEQIKSSRLVIRADTPVSLEIAIAGDANTMHSAAGLLTGLTKAELHLQIEGILEPELAFRLAKKHDVVLPYSGVEALRGAAERRGLTSLDVYAHGPKP